MIGTSYYYSTEVRIDRFRMETESSVHSIGFHLPAALPTTIMVKQKRTITIWIYIVLCSETLTHHTMWCRPKMPFLRIDASFETSETWNESTERPTDWPRGMDKNNIFFSQSKHAINRKHLTQHNPNKKVAFFDSTICAFKWEGIQKSLSNINTHMCAHGQRLENNVNSKAHIYVANSFNAPHAISSNALIISTYLPYTHTHTRAVFHSLSNAHRFSISFSLGCCSCLCRSSVVTP